MKSAASLDRYRAKRNFDRTPEPEGEEVPAGQRLIIQHHFATRDHYDLRLEIGGVLASWAVTRGPSANPRDRRLAVRTEDHPLDYADFEGLIPKGEYGGGTVILWEYATYSPANGDPDRSFRKGEIKFVAHGERMRGGWVLVRMNTKEKRENWLLIKERDDFAEDDDSLTRRFTKSISSDRSRKQIERRESSGPESVSGPRGFPNSFHRNSVQLPSRHRGRRLDLRAQIRWLSPGARYGRRRARNSIRALVSTGRKNSPRSRWTRAGSAAKARCSTARPSCSTKRA